MIARDNHLADLDLSLWLKLTQWLTPLEMAYLLMVNKSIRALFMRDVIWQNPFNIVNHAEFLKRVSFLQDPDLKDTFNQGFMSLEKAIETQEILNLTEYERIRHMCILTGRYGDFMQYLFKSTNRVIIALKEELVTIDQLINNDFYINLLEKDLGLIYLRKKLPRPSGLVNRRFNKKLVAFATPNGINALEEQLMTLDQIKLFTAKQLKEILSDEGMEALRDKLFTPEDLFGYLSRDLKELANEFSTMTGVRYQDSANANQSIGKYIQLMQGVALERLLTNLFQLYVYVLNWEPSDSNQGINACFCLPLSDKRMGILQRLRHKLEEQGIQLIIDDRDNKYITKCFFSERYYQKIKSALLAMPAPDSTPDQPLPHHRSTIFYNGIAANTKNSLLRKTPTFSLIPLAGSIKPKPVSEFDRLFAALFVVHADTANLRYAPLVDKVLFPFDFVPSQEQIDKCSALLSEANIKHTLINRPSVRYCFEIQGETEKTFIAKIKNLHDAKMNLASKHPECNVHQPKI